MKIDTIKYLIKREDLKNSLTEVDCSQAEHFLKIREEHVPCLHVTKNNNLKIIINFNRITTDKGTKHEKVPLSRYMLGQKKIPLLESGFKNPKQAPRSIRALLKRAEKEDDQNVYILGVNESIFNALKKDISAFKELVKDSIDHQAENSDSQIRHTSPPDPLAQIFLGTSDQAEKIRFFIKCAAETDDEVLILGETGTGKEVIAKAIHLLRFGNLERMQVVNCAAISENLLESELFGYKKGAFTGAEINKPGLWKLAHDSTLFLDEIGDLSKDHQAKILRALSDKKIRPVGSNSQIGVNARIIAATNVDLVSRVRSSEFRDDLYYRLNTFPIFVPPLRDRKEDISILASTFWANNTPDTAKPLSNEILEEMKKRDWPGNVRVLHSFLRCLRTLYHAKIARTEEITTKDLFFALAYHGQHYFQPTPGPHSEDVLLHPAHCLRRLKRVSDILFSIKLAITSLLEDQTAKTVHQDTIRNNIKELRMLCTPKDAVLFHSVPTLNEVCGFADEMSKLDSKLFSAPNGESASWFKLSNKLTQVMEIVFDEINRITA